MTDTFNLQRFVAAQESEIDLAMRELKAGKKESCWMWYIFPQFLGLGSSMMSRTYAISSQEEALAFLAHPIVGARLRACTQTVLDLQGRTAQQIFSGDDIKFHSCMTLFAAAESSPNIFEMALSKYFNGAQDNATLVLLDQCMRQQGCSPTQQ